MQSDTWVGIDWGSSHFRAYLIRNRQLVDTFESNQGVLKFTAADYQTYLAQCLTKWSLAEGALVLMSGMIGSNQGWKVCDYLPCPVDIEQLSWGLHSIDNDLGFDIRIVAGVNIFKQQHFDVMRGEEVQVFGCGIDDGWICLPGTHAKWVRVQQGAIVDFDTFLTGEMYSLMSEKSCLAACVKDAETFCQTAFKLGLKSGFEAPCLTQQLFAIRANYVCGRTDSDQSNSYLSGLLLAQEFKFIKQKAIGHFYLLASDELVSLYQLAADFCDLDCDVLDCQQATINGLARLI